MSFPAELSNAMDGVTEVVAAHLNHLEAKVGTDNSAVATSLDYLLKNAGSIDPGHKHTAGAFSGGNNGEVLYKTAGAWGPGTPEAAGLVAKSGDQSIAGVKTFTSIPLGPASNPTTDNQLARKAYVDLMLPLAGGTMAGNIAMNNHKVTGMAAASGTGEALRYDEWILTQDPGHKHSKLWASDGSLQAVTVNADSNVGIGTTNPSSVFGGGGGSVSLKTMIAGAPPSSDYPLFAVINNTAYSAGVDKGANISFGGIDSNGSVQSTAQLLGVSIFTASGAGTGYFAFRLKSASFNVDNSAAEKMRITSEGNVGIGTTTPITRLSIYGTPRVEGDSSSLIDLVDTTAFGAGVGPGINFISKWNAAGNYNSSQAYIKGVKENATDGNYAGALIFGTRPNAGDATERIRITSGGNVGIGTTSPGYLLTCNGQPGANGYTAWTNYSDIRFKQDIVSLKDNILTMVLKLNPVTFSYNDKNPWGEKPGERKLRGFIAQELQELFPDMVGEAQGPDGEKYLTTNLSNLPLYLVQALKEQQAQIEALQAKLN